MVNKNKRKESKKGNTAVNLLGLAFIVSGIFFVFYFLAEKMQIVPIPSLNSFWGLTMAESGIIFAVMFVLILFLTFYLIMVIRSRNRIIQPERNFDVKLISDKESFEIKVRKGRITKKNPAALIGGNVKETIEAQSIQIYRKEKKTGKRQELPEMRENLLTELDSGSRVYLEAKEIKIKRGKKK